MIEPSGNEFFEEPFDGAYAPEQSVPNHQSTYYNYFMGSNSDANWPLLQQWKYCRLYFIAT